MKKLLLILLCVPLIVISQVNDKDYISILPYDSVTKLVAFEEVIEYSGLTADELYNSLKEWIATSTFWKSDVNGVFLNTTNIREVEEAVLQLDDREGKKIIAKCRTKIKYGGSYAYHNYNLKIYIKEGRFKYIITNIVQDQGISYGTELSYPLEQFYSGYSKKGRIIKWQLKYHTSVVDFANRISGDIQDKVKMIVSDSKNDDW